MLCYIAFSFAVYLLLALCKTIQPDSPAELGNKIYEMMAIALGGRWGRPESEDEAAADAESSSEAGTSETADAEVVEPSEVRAEEDPWKD